MKTLKIIPPSVFVCKVFMVSKWYHRHTTLQKNLRQKKKQKACDTSCRTCRFHLYLFIYFSFFKKKPSSDRFHTSLSHVNPMAMKKSNFSMISQQG